MRPTNETGYNPAVFASEHPASSHPSIDLITGALVFVVCLLVFWFSPVHQVTDSHYSMLLSESLLKHRSFSLDAFNLPRLEPNVSTRDYYVMNGDIWQLELVRGHIYYYFPPGSSILSLPFVKTANALGISVANSDGTYNPENETKIQTALAAILMALLAAGFYFTGRLILPRPSSIVIALGGALGTQIWSTASRGLWSHTWSAVLTGLIAYLLLTSETNRRKINPIVLASLLAWLYFVRPNGSVVVGAVTAYIFLFRRELIASYMLTGGLWLAGFIAYSWINFGKPLPSYFYAGRLRLDLLPIAFLGNVLSPSRGLFIYVPVLIFVAYLLVIYCRYIPHLRLVGLSIAICGLHILFVSMFANLWGDWWGGASFGPRYTTELVPWFVLLTVLGWKGRLTVKELRSAKPHELIGLKIETTFGLLLLGLSVVINARGATSLDTWKWSQPSTDQQLRALLWDWRHPQFLAGLQSPAPPVEFPLIRVPTLIDLTNPESGKHLWYGWSGAEKNFRWTDGREAAFVFSLNEGSDLILDLRLAPFLSEGLEQRLNVKLNDQVVTTLTLAEGEIRTYSVRLSNSLMKTRNVLKFELPNATSPASLGTGTDRRVLGVKVESMKFAQGE